MEHIVVQRIAVSWPSDRRGAEAANLRSDIPPAFALPHGVTGSGRLVTHDVALTDEDGYRPRALLDEMTAEPPDNFGLRLVRTAEGLTVHRTSTGDAFPQRHPRALFTLASGEFGRYRANYRFTTASGRWRYALWTFNIGWGITRVDTFVDTAPKHEVDEQVSLYGGPRRASR